MQPIEIWQAAAEARPLAQTGGLADVLRALPAALARSGHRVRRFLPGYGSVDRDGFVEEPPALEVPLGPAPIPVRFLARAEREGVVTTLVVCDELFGRPELYGPPGGEFPDNARRFALFSRAVAERARRAVRPPAILHAHDWHPALAPLFARLGPAPLLQTGTVLTLHNMAYQGSFAEEETRWLSLDPRQEERLFQPDGIEYHGGINFLKAGLFASDRWTTVSPSYAREILTPEFGCGLDGFLAKRRKDLTGILNGADYELWNPASDPHLPQAYGPDSLDLKEKARQALRRDFDLGPEARPVVGVVSRLAHQKGIDILAAAIPELWEAGADLAILGDGDPALVQQLRRLRAKQPLRMGLEIQYNDRLAHRVVAGSDFVLLPSRYEPCGLTQMYALRYGTIPVVTRTGGLADTVRDESAAPGRGTGFVMRELSAAGLVEAVRRGLALRAGGREAWRALQRRAMAEDFSWDKAAGKYAELYEEIAREGGTRVPL